MEIDGKYFLPKSPKFYKAKAIILGDSISILDEEDNLLEESEVSKVTLERFSNSITFRTGSVFSPADVRFRWNFRDNTPMIFEKIKSTKSVILLCIFLLPLVGWFFRSLYNPKTEKSEMIIFLTPRIVNQEEAGLVDKA